MTDSSAAHRTLVLLRHAKSAWPDLPDHERPLAPRGERDAPVMGRWLRTTGHLPDQVLCSSALRTRQTWQLAQAQLGMTPPVAFEDEIYQASPEELLTLIRLTSPTVNTLLVIGHDPAIPELARTLPTSGEGGAATNARVMGKFPTAAIAILEFTGNWDQLATGSTRLTCFVTPRDLQVTSEAE